MISLEEIAEFGLNNWAGTESSDLPGAINILSCIVGDLNKHVRTYNESGQELVNDRAVKKELGNLIVSTIRLIEELDYGVNECIGLAKIAQKRYARRLLKND